MHLCSSSRCVRVSATPKFDASESAPEPISGLTRHAGIAPRMFGEIFRAVEKDRKRMEYSISTYAATAAGARRSCGGADPRQSESRRLGRRLEGTMSS